MFIGRRNVTLAAVIPTPLRGHDCDEIWIVIMILKNLDLLPNVDADLICLLMIMKIICWCWLTVGSWIMFAIFQIKFLVDLSIFALIREQARYLQDFIVWPKCPQTETAQTETAQTESARPKSRLPVLHNIWLHLTKTTPLICILVTRINRFIA